MNINKNVIRSACVAASVCLMAGPAWAVWSKPVAVPEPGSLMLLGMGVAAFAIARLKNK